MNKTASGFHSCWLKSVSGLRRHTFGCAMAGFVVTVGLMSATRAAGDESDTAVLIRAAAVTVDAYHADAGAADNVIRLVYFHPRDREPLASWRERLSRNIDDILKFYNDAFERFGLTGRQLRCETDADGLVIHVVKGERDAARYDYDTGDAIEQEIRQSLDGKIDFSTSHVLVLHALCHKEADGRYVFRAPYYGRGSQVSGFCHAADCELLDANLLPESTRRIVYTEHYYPRVEQTVGLFNSWYLGGMAHELGHGIGLPHDAGNRTERRTGGHALMGSGNLHYREDKWGGTRPSYLSAGSVLRLLSSPLLTQSDFNRHQRPLESISDVEFSDNARELTAKGTIPSGIPAYAVIGYIWKPLKWPGNPQQDHQSISHLSLVRDGRFRINFPNLKQGDYRLRLSVLFCNGASTNRDHHLTVDALGSPNTAELNDHELLAMLEAHALSRLAELDSERFDTAMASVSTPEVRQKLQILRDICHPPEATALADTALETVFLSDADWTAARVGWGETTRNHYDIARRHRNSIYLELKGKFYSKGLYAHSDSRYAFRLNRRWKKLSATVGLRDGAHRQGSAVFTVKGDGTNLYKSRILRVGQSEDIKLDIGDVEQLELLTQGGEGHNHNSWAVWCMPKVTR